MSLAAMWTQDRKYSIFQKTAFPSFWRPSFNKPEGASLTFGRMLEKVQGLPLPSGRTKLMRDCLSPVPFLQQQVPAS